MVGLFFVPLKSSHSPVVTATLMALATAPLALDAATPPSAPALLELHRPLVIAHRGFSVAAPENTLASFRLALAAGVDLVELDFHATRDGQLIVIHDAVLDRTTNAVARFGGTQLRVADHTAAELQGLDAGSWFDGRPAQRLPLLAEALDLIQSHGTATLIERKTGDAASLARLLTDRNLVNHVVVQSFDWNFLRELHALLPGQVLGALGPPHVRATGAPAADDGVLDDFTLDELNAIGARVVVWNSKLAAQAIIAAHARHLKVWLYTIDEPALARDLLDRGVDGLITNNAAIIWKTLAERNAPAAR